MQYALKDNKNNVILNKRGVPFLYSTRELALMGARYLGMKRRLRLKVVPHN